MSVAPVVTSVVVEDDGARRTTTVRVVEGGGTTSWIAEASSVPPEVRAELAAWLGRADPPPERGEPPAFSDGGLHVGAGAVVQFADGDRRSVTARTTGFTVPG